LLIGGCANDPKGAERDPVPVMAQRVRILPEQLNIEAVGTARAALSADIFPESAGLVTRVHFSPGEAVGRGAPLVQLDARREKLAVELAQVQVREAAQLLARYRRIEGTGAISESQIEAGETALASARVALEQAKVALADRTVRAPFSGHIGLTDVDRGDRISQATQIAQLDNRSTLYVDFPAPEATFNRLRPGQTVTVTPYSDPDRTIEARVRAVDSTISADQRNYTVRTIVPNEGDRLRPGMSFRVRFEGIGRPRPAVREEAVVWGSDGAYLWAVRDGRARRVPVTIASRRDGLVLVDAKLQADDTIIVEGVQKVREGQPVRLVKPAVPPPQRVRLQPATPAAAGTGNAAEEPDGR
jgi:RND family efflux transporter MFP subunit